eukprot:9478329-Pyramimonas_sp.AAC.1
MAVVMVLVIAMAVIMTRMIDHDDCALHTMDRRTGPTTHGPLLATDAVDPSAFREVLDGIPRRPTQDCPPETSPKTSQPPRRGVLTGSQQNIQNYCPTAAPKRTRAGSDPLLAPMAGMPAIVLVTDPPTPRPRHRLRHPHHSASLEATPKWGGPGPVTYACRPTSSLPPPDFCSFFFYSLPRLCLE